MFSHRMRSPRRGSARSGGRWVGLGASALLFIAGVSVVALSAPVASAADCHDVEVVFARGTDEPPGLGRVGDALVDSLRDQTGMDIGTYAVDYKASKLQLHGGDGAKDVIKHVKSTVSECPDTQIVLGGYSQGASVMDIVAGVPVGGIKWGDSLPPEFVKNIAAVATFGDVATRTDQALPTHSTLLGSKAIDLCNPADPICHAGPGNAWSGHTEGYVPAYTNQAAVFVASKLLPTPGQSLPGYGQAVPPGYGVSPGYGLPPGPSTPAYNPDSSVHGPPPGYGPAPGYPPQTPDYGLQPPDSSVTPYPGYGLV